REDPRAGSRQGRRQLRSRRQGPASGFRRRARHRRLEVRGSRLDLPARDSDRTGDVGRPERGGSLQARPAAAVRQLQDAELAGRVVPPEDPMIADIAKGAAVLFVAAILQVTLLSQIDVFHGAPDLVLVTLVSVALLRGTIFGAAAGFGAGLRDGTPPRQAP